MAKHNQFPFEDDGKDGQSTDERDYGYGGDGTQDEGSQDDPHDMSGKLDRPSDSWQRMLHGVPRFSSSGEISHRRSADERYRAQWEWQETDVLPDSPPGAPPTPAFGSSVQDSPPLDPWTLDRREHLRIVPPPDIRQAPATPELPSLPNLPTVPHAGPNAGPTRITGSHQPPTDDPQVRRVWEASPQGHAFANAETAARNFAAMRAEMQDYQQQVRSAQQLDIARFEQRYGDQSHEGHEGHHQLVSQTQKKQQKYSQQYQQPRARAYNYDSASGAGSGGGYGGNYGVPMRQIAVESPPEDIVAVGGSVGEKLWRTRVGENEMARAVLIANPDLGPDEPVPICIMMERPLRYRARGDEWRQSRGVTPTINREFPSRILASLSTMPRMEMMTFAHHAFPTRPSLLEVGGRLLQPSDIRGHGFAHFIENDPFLRLLVAMYWVRMYLANEVLAVSVNRHPDYIRPSIDIAPDSPQFAHFEPGADQGTYFGPFGPMDNTGWRWQSWHGRYYTHLWQRASILLCNHRLLDSQTATYLQTSHVPPLAGNNRMDAVVRHWRAKEGKGFPPELAWNDYRTWLASKNYVPQAVIDSRLDWQSGDWTIKDLSDYQRLISRLVDSSPELDKMREIAAASMRRKPRDTILWLLEPMRRATIHGER